MTKYYRRVGTTAFRFQIEAHIQKIELKVPTANPYPQRLSVIFKRGELRKETKNAPLMEDGVAYFNEKLSVPGILYYDNRKKTFLQKEATLAVNLISKRSTKLMGVTRFDLATFVNNNITEKDVVLKMEKCSDKNAKFFFKLMITQVKELGSMRKSMKISFKDSSIRSGSFRGSMKEVSFKESLKESFKEKMEESKGTQLQKIDDEADELYSYYTESEGSPKRSARIEENEENNIEMLNSPHNIAFDQLRSSTNEPGVCNISTLDENEIQEEVYNFDLLDTEIPQRCQSPEIKKYGSRAGSLFMRKQSTRELEEKILNYEKDLDNSSKALKVKNEDYERLKEDYEKLQQAYNLQSQSSENNNIKDKEKEKEYDDEDKENIPNINYGQIKNSGLEKKINQLENQNDVLNKRVQELEKLNNDYLAQIEKHIEEKNQPEIIVSNNNIGHQYEIVVEGIVNRLKEHNQIPQNEIDHIEDIMYELINKIKESEQTIHKLKESHRIEKEKNQKDTEILEQGLQKFIREHDQYHYKYPIKGALASYETGIYHSQTMSSNSLKTREESIAEEPSIRGVLYDSGEHNSSDLKGSPRAFGGQGNESARGGSVNEILSLKQEINYLNAKLFAMTNIQKQYEEQVKQRHALQQENKTLKSDLEKANKGWTYAEEERYELANKIQEYKDSPTLNTELIDALEMQVFRLKTKIGEVMNVALELGGANLLDKIESIMVQEESSEMTLNPNKQTFAY